MVKLLSMYMVYVIYFLGIGMVSSGIVLMPFNVARYSTILSIGLLLFISGASVNEFYIDKKELSFKKMIKLVLVSLSLAIGIGMMSGGISHFKESPIYVSYLIPLGFMISLASFTIKNGYILTKKVRVFFVMGILVIGLFSHLTLSTMANHYLMNGKTTPGGDIFMDGH